MPNMEFQREDKKALVRSHTVTMLIILSQAREMHQEVLMLVAVVVGVVVAVAVALEEVAAAAASVVEAQAVLSISLKLLCLEVSPHSINGNSK